VTRVVLSAAAAEDRRAITAYTVERFGLEQARLLRDRLRAAFEALAETPHIGRLREELDPPGRSFRYFVVMRILIIAYQPTDEGIRVARILHGARRLAAELERDPGAGPDRDA
jgi:plasmid stabilization system protein ParE